MHAGTMALQLALVWKPQHCCLRPSVLPDLMAPVGTKHSWHGLLLPVTNTHEAQPGLLSSVSNTQ